jgi:hypothetical protein
MVAALESCLARGAPMGVTATPPACEPSPPFWDSAPSVAIHELLHKEGQAAGVYALNKDTAHCDRCLSGKPVNRVHKHSGALHSIAHYPDSTNDTHYNYSVHAHIT